MVLSEHFQTDDMNLVKSTASLLNRDVPATGEELLELFALYKANIRELLASGERLSLYDLSTLKARLLHIKEVSVFVSQQIEKENQQESVLIADIQSLL